MDIYKTELSKEILLVKMEVEMYITWVSSAFYLLIMYMKTRDGILGEEQ